MEHFELDRTDEEREELVKQWIKDYWLMLVVVLVGAIGAVYGLNYYKQSKLNELNETATKTEVIGEALRNNEVERAQELVNAIQTNEKDTSFSAVATLSLAQKYFNNKNYDKAAQQYDWVITQSDDVAMRNLARLRKARTLSDAKQVQAAIDTLNSIEGNVNLLETALLKGDILLADKQFEKAKKAYESIPKNQQMNENLINQRLELLNIMQQKQQK